MRASHGCAVQAPCARVLSEPSFSTLVEVAPGPQGPPRLARVTPPPATLVLRAFLPSTPRHEGLSRDRSVEHVSGFRIAPNGVRCDLVWRALRAHTGPRRGGARARALRRRRAWHVGRDRLSRCEPARPGSSSQERGRGPHLCRGSCALGGLPRRLAGAPARDPDIGRRLPHPRRSSGAERPYLPGWRVSGMRRRGVLGSRRLTTTASGRRGSIGAGSVTRRASRRCPRVG